MIETMGDVLSIGVMAVICLMGIYILFIVYDKHHDQAVKAREEAYYAFYEDMVEGQDDQNDDSE